MSGPHSLDEGMLLFRRWFVSGEGVEDGGLHDRFLAWGDHESRAQIRNLYQIAHGERPFL